MTLIGISTVVLATYVLGYYLGTRAQRMRDKREQIERRIWN